MLRYGDVLNHILSEVPGPRDAALRRSAETAFRIKQLFAAEYNHKGWAFLRREGVARFGGGYDDGSLAITQNSRDVVLSGGTFPVGCEGWRIGGTGGEEEIYTVVTRTDGTNVIIDRPYEGDTVTAAAYSMYDPYGLLPADYAMSISAVLESGSRQLGNATFPEPRAVWPKPLLFGNAYISMHAEPSTVARQNSSTVTIAKADATVTLAAGSWPEWIVGRHIKFDNETALYKVLSRTSDTVIELDRNYGGVNAGATKSYELDPPGSYQLEIAHPQQNQCALKLWYFCDPQEPVNETDLIEGDNKYAYAIADMAAADVIAGLPGVEREQYEAKATMLANRGLAALDAKMTGGPEPQQTKAIQDIRYTGGGRTW
ncbi:MAG: hypothetical protein ACTSX8_09400 [Alphaproteobacteria bacterium]